jgi:predicted outer membrane protein
MMQTLSRRTGGYLAFAVLAASLSWLTGAGAQPGKTPPAKVTVSGKEMGTITSIDGDKKDRYVLVEEDNRTTLRVSTDQDVTKFAEEVLADHQKLLKAFQATVQKLIEKKDFDGIKKLETTFKEASEELLKNIGNVTATGTLSMEGDTLRIDGKLRVYDFKGLDKDLGKGKALVEGEATQVKYDTGAGEKLMLAVHNGAKAIVITGKAAENMANASGTIRAVGVLRAGKNGHPLLEAEKIEKVKK